MKMFFVVYPDYCDERITKAFKKEGFKSYTKTREAIGEGKETAPKLGTTFSPGRNNILLMAVPDEDIPHLVELVRRLKAEVPKAGVRAFTFPLEECV